MKHVDIGSRVDGFVAHVASFRDVEVFDIRDLSNSIQNIKFRRFNLIDNIFPATTGTAFLNFPKFKLKPETENEPGDVLRNK